MRKLKCASVMEALNAKVFTNTVKGIGQLSVRLRDADVLVLIRERTLFPKQLLEKLPKLKLISQTGKAGAHIDVETCTQMGIAVAEGVGSPVAPAELTWALIMAAMRRLAPVHRQPQAWGLAAVGAQGGRRCRPISGWAWCLQGQDARHLGLRQDRPTGGGLRQGLRHAHHWSGAASRRAKRAIGMTATRPRPAAKNSSRPATCSACTCGCTTAPAASSSSMRSRA